MGHKTHHADCDTFKENQILRQELRRVTEEIDIAKKRLSSCFSENQIKTLFHGKSMRPARWTEEDICRALMLKSSSNKTYNFLREKWHFPLPSKSTLCRWVSNIDVEPGILMCVLNVLKHKSLSMPEADRVSVLSFDECSLSNEWSYDQSTDKIYDPKKSVQCVMLRGLVQNWKQIIFYDFDCPMTKCLLFRLIEEVEAAGFPVVAMVCDLGPTNVKLWNSLEITSEQTFFTNPADTNREIFVFADAPHLLKLIRNNFLDHGFVLDNGQYVLSQCVQQLIAHSRSDIKVTHRLSSKHINVKGPHRMKVKLAAQLLSETTAKTLRYFGRKGYLSKDWDATSDFILLADSWFDAFNSRLSYDKKESRNAYGTDLPRQNQILSKMENTVRAMKVCGANRVYQFQKGLLVSSQSLPKLYQMLNERYNIKYILTSRLNQDSLEHLFGSLRKLGGLNDNPSPVSVKHRLRMHILGRDHSLLRAKNDKQSSTNVTKCDSPTDDKTGEEVDEDERLHNELTLSAMVFSSMVRDQNLENENFPPLENEPQLSNSEDVICEKDLEHAIEEEGQIYFGGYLANRFPEYDLSSKVRKVERSTLTDDLCWRNCTLKHPTPEFLEKLKIMEQQFICYHGKNKLKPGKQSINKLTEETCKLVDLPAEVVHAFVRCRTFFKIRTLNRELNSWRTEAKRYKKKKFDAVRF